jgi:hypothetical protein
MKSYICAFLLLLGPAISDAVASNVPCPDLGTAAQVAACPTEDDLKYTFTGFCSDNARMYGKDAEVCTDYQRYRKLKNVALWESQDGVFEAYISCDLPAASVKQAKASNIAVTRKADITRLACTYREGVIFTSRTRAECTVDVKSNCAADPTACVAKCE